jgi:hypothetical protein
MEPDLKAIYQYLSTPPCNRNWSNVELHDEVTGQQLLKAVLEIVDFFTMQPTIHH